MNDLVALFLRGIDEFDARVRAIGDDQWDNTTPCTDWNVRDLVNHMTSEALWAPHILSGKTIEEAGDAFKGDAVGSDPKATWELAAEEEKEAVQQAGITDATIHLSRGPTPASEYLAELFSDHVIHAWDLARGIGGDDRLDPQLVEVLYGSLAPFETQLKASGLYGDKVEAPKDADTQTKLLAVVGRKS